MNETINAITTWLDGKLQKMLANLANILTHNPVWVNLNTCLFYYFFQVDIHLGKLSKHPYIHSKLL